MAHPKPTDKLRLFTTFEQTKNDDAANTASRKRAQHLELLAAGSSRWAPFYALTSTFDLPTTALLLHCIAHGHASSSGKALMEGFDRSPARAARGRHVGSGGRDSGSSSSGSGSAEGRLAAALADRLVPGWWYLTHTAPFWSWQLQASLASCT